MLKSNYNDVEDNLVAIWLVSYFDQSHLKYVFIKISDKSDILENHINETTIRYLHSR